MSSLVPPSFPIDEALRQAVSHHQAGRLHDAESLYLAILRLQPLHPDANHNLGSVTLQSKQPAASLHYFKTALEASPNHGQYWLSYIEALIQAGHTNAARLVLAQGRQQGLQGSAVEVIAERLAKGVLAEEQITTTRQTEESFPVSSVAPKIRKRASGKFSTRKEKTPSPQEINEFATLFAAERYTESATLAHKMASDFPMHGVGWKALGVVFQKMGRSEEALANMQKAAALLPGDAEIFSNLGCILYDLRRLDEAESSFRRALELKPDFLEAHNNLGNTLQHLGRLDEAEAMLRRVLQIKPNYSKAHSNLGNILYEQGRLEEAEVSYRRALGVNSNFAEAHSNLGNALLGQGRVPEAVAGFRRALEIKPNFTEARSLLLFSLNLLPKCIPGEMLTEARIYGKVVAQKARPYNSWPNDPDPFKRLRIGLVSGDFVKHPVGFFLEGVLKSIAEQSYDQLEIFAYHCDIKNDALTARIRASCHGWRVVAGFSDESLAMKIRDDGIDILIDLSGHTLHNRLPMFAWKPAPVQVSWLGYSATTGVAAIDYLIADPWVLPEQAEAFFTEKIWRLPETRLCFTPPDIKVEVSSLPALDNGYITFGCFNNLAKMNEDVVALWARVLTSVPGSRLFLKAKQLQEVTACQNTLECFAAYGIEADRLTMEGFETREKYFAAYHRVDIALDPFPYPGGTTSVEGLWMGVPVLTLAGDCFLSRQGVGILMNAGLPNWVATDANDYVARAVTHASDLCRLADLRSRLREDVLASPIFDTQRFAQSLGSALRGMWQDYSKGKKGYSSSRAIPPTPTF